MAASASFSPHLRSRPPREASAHPLAPAQLGSEWTSNEATCDPAADSGDSARRRRREAVPETELGARARPLKSSGCRACWSASYPARSPTCGMLRSAVAALAPSGLPGRPLLLTALSLSPGKRLSSRGPAGQSEQRRGPAKPRFPPLRIPEEAETTRLVAEKARAPPPLRRFIACPDLARAVASSLQSGRRSEGPETVVLECEPGPGVLTRTLLNAGAHVIALESNKSFVPDLESLKEKADGQLEVVHCDFFRLDPMGIGSLKPPFMYSERLFENLGILTVPWTADVPLKVIGIVPQRKERNLIWKLLYALYERSSIYKYGRTELNLFVSEKEYKTLVAKPGETRIYQPLSVLWQTACDIQLLRMEPWPSFLTNSKNGGLSIPKSVLLQNDHLCLIRLTPRKNLFTDSLTTSNSRIFVVMVKQCLAKSKTKLIDKLNLWSSQGGKELLRQLEIPENITTGSLYPEQYKSLFEIMEQANEFDQSWLYDEDSLEDSRGINF
ncbi:dimethyladenosine transferase 2, mitochondrial [Podarcis lilfordi]|uniref:rRNA adenine N(6)-methyltransferase n=1 Tax=Podarcis lilfordi TaxID=74358 RepID=A0AA35P030_9SAUR|nr:dimethyladenosine transferase 2, mitochondrial [Podarcis lilfordi]